MEHLKAIDTFRPLILSLVNLIYIHDVSPLLNISCVIVNAFLTNAETCAIVNPLLYSVLESNWRVLSNCKATLILQNNHITFSLF